MESRPVKVVIECPQCNQKLGLPRHLHKTLHVTCPTCGHTFDFNADSHDRRRSDVDTPQPTLPVAPGKYLPSTTSGLANPGVATIGVATVAGVAIMGFRLVESGAIGRGASGFSRLFENILPNPVGLVAYLALFVAMAVFSIKLICSLPLRPSWERIEGFSKTRLARISPLVFPVVVFITNFLPTRIIELIYTDRLFVTYLASILLACFHGTVVICKPKDLTTNAFAHPVARVCAVMFAASGVTLQALVTLSLFPATIAHAPSNWTDVFWPG